MTASATTYLDPPPERRLDPRLSPDFYARLFEYMGGGPENEDPAFRSMYDEWWMDHAGRRARWIRDDVLWRLQRERSLDGLRLLDFGCGTGSSAVAFAEAGARVLGIDTDAVSLRVADQRVRDLGHDARVLFVRIPYIMGPGDRLALADSSFDVVALIGVLEHMKEAEREACALEIWRVLRPGGELFLFDTPNRWHPFDHHTTRLWWVGWLPVPLARIWAILRRRISLDADFARRGGTGISRRRIAQLFPAGRWSAGYDKEAAEIAGEFGWAARSVPWFGRRWPEPTRAALESIGRAWISATGRLGCPPQAWVASHTMSLFKR